MLRKGGKGHWTPLTHRIAETVQQDRAKPGEELALAVIVAEALPDFNQRVLGQVLRTACLAAERHRLLPQPRLKTPATLPNRSRPPRPGRVKKAARLWASDFYERRIQ